MCGHDLRIGALQEVQCLTLNRVRTFSLMLQATSLQGIHSILTDILNGELPPPTEPKAEGEDTASTLHDTHAVVVRALQRLGGEIASLEQYCEGFARTDLGRLQPFIVAHQQGIVAVLANRLRSLLVLTVQLRSVAATAANLAAASKNVGVPGELTLPSIVLGRAPSETASGTSAKSVDSGDGTGRSGTAERLGASVTTQPNSEQSGPGRPATSTAAGDGAPQLLELATVSSSQQAVDAQRVEQQMAEVSSMLTLLSEKLSEQQEDVQAILEHAVEARTHVVAGNKELAKANERPRSLRDFVVALLLLLTAILWFLDWYAR